MPDAENAITWVQSWSRYNRKEIVNAVLEALPALGPDLAGTLIGSLPAARRPDFARLILQQLADSEAPATPQRPRLAAKPKPTSTGKRPPQS